MGSKFNEFKRARFDVGILEPWLLGVRLRAEAGPFLEWAEDHTREKDAGYVLEQSFQGINFQLRRDVNRYTTVRLTQKNTFARQTLEFTDSTLTTDSAKVAIRTNTAPHYRTHSLLLVFERDLRDNFLLTRRGNITIASFELAGGALTGTSNFTKLELNQSWFTPVRQMVLATRIRAGVITPFGPQDNVVVGADDPKVAGIPLQDRFRTGGVNSIRGYNENDIPHAPAYGGLAILQANLELRIPIARLPLLGNLGFESFLDMGNVWARPEYIRWQQFRPSISRTPYGDQDVRYVFGVGPRFELPIGPLRVDLSWSARPSNTGTGQRVRGYLAPRWQFAIGPSI
jgi:outer membrane protein assembly factor BamA